MNNDAIRGRNLAINPHWVEQLKRMLKKENQDSSKKNKRNEKKTD